MKMTMFRKLFATTCLLLVALFFPLQTFASDYFSRDYAVTYAVKESGVTTVSINVTLSNKTSDYYASSDTIDVGFSDISNLSAHDPDGPITPQVKKSESGNSINLTFNKHVVGKDKSLVFNVTFDTPEIARREGKIWEINIPGIANPDEFTNFNAQVDVPPSFGQPAFIKPAQTDNKLLFTKDQLGKAGISIAYGTQQDYAFQLTYHLQNKNVFPIRTEIALPPTTNYQDIAIQAMNPKPENVHIDSDGNWLATYVLSPAQKMDVTVIGNAQVSFQPKSEPLTQKEFETYTKEQPYWQVSNPEIQKLAKQLKTPRAIYDYVVKNLTYDFNRVTQNQDRLGALKALQTKNSAVCLEFTDLFIALARAAGIPAREVNGYAHTENAKQRPLSLVQDILHAWPEYYDQQKQAWVMVDPTWGNTTGGTDYFDVFDFDHLVFVQKGVSSEYPIPAGGYKFDGDEEKKDVSVTLADTFPQDPPTLQLLPAFPDTTLSGFPINGSVTVTNTGHTLVPAQKAVVSSSLLKPSRVELGVAALPPFGSVVLPIKFDNTPLFTNKHYNFTFALQDTIIHANVAVTPFAFSKLQLILGGVGLVLLAIIISFFAIKARRVSLSQPR
jgi:transglutaminase-like putative cysteine protease